MRDRLGTSIRFLAFAAGLLAASWLSPRLAQACSCRPTTWASWPVDGASKVPLVPSIVVQRTPAGEDAPAYLEAADGTTVSLELRNTLAEPYFCVERLEFLQPVEPLAPHTNYTVKFAVTPPADEYYFESSSFTTGSADDAEEAPTPVAVGIFHIENSSCGQEDGDECTDFAEVNVGSKTLAGSPTWARFSTKTETSVAPLGTGALSSDPDGLVPHEEFVEFLLSVASKSECIDYERIDVRGEVIEQRELCTYDKCVVAAPEPSGINCGDSNVPIPLGAAVWSDVSGDSCGNPPEATWNGNGWELVSADKNVFCSVRTRAGASPAWAWLAALPLFVLGYRRRHPR